LEPHSKLGLKLNPILELKLKPRPDFTIETKTKIVFRKKLKRVGEVWNERQLLTTNW
jgi:hypothetical protein